MCAGAGADLGQPVACALLQARARMAGPLCNFPAGCPALQPLCAVVSPSRWKLFSLLRLRMRSPVHSHP